MGNTKDQTGGMGKLSKKTAESVDEELKETELTLLKGTTADLESLRPRISDGGSFDKLIEAVNASTRRNESLAELRQRIIKLGEGVVKVAGEVLRIMK